jgi:TRAP-type C4-dicarboxylate transport system permease small subunit
MMDRVTDYLAIFSGILIGYCLLAINSEVLMRYALSKTSAWPKESTEYALFLITLLGANWVLKRDKHIAMDLIVEWLNPKARLLLAMTTSLLCSIVCFIITWYGVRVTWEHFQMGYMLIKGLTVPSAPMMAVIPISSLLLSIQFLRRAYGYLEGWKTS